MGDNSNQGRWRVKSDTTSRNFMDLAKSYKYSQEQRDIFKLFSKFCELTKISTMDDVHNKLNDLKNEDYGTAQKFFDFIDLYARENSTSLNIIIDRYENLDYPPAEERAKILDNVRRYKSVRLVLYTEKNVEISMPEKPNYSKFRSFLYSFMTNIMYL